MKPQSIPLDKILVNHDYQIRESLDTETINEYADAYRQKQSMPAVDVYRSDDEFILADGFHRVAAAKQAGLKTIQANIHIGKAPEILTLAFALNSRHGRRMTNADKRRAVMLSLKQWPKLADREIARLVFVTHTLVAEVRHSMSDVAAAANLHNCRDKKTSQHQALTNTGKIHTEASRQGPCSEFSVNKSADLDAYVTRREEVDPADKMEPSMPVDAATAKSFVEGTPESFPKTVSFEVLTLEEEYLLHTTFEKILVKRGKKKTSKIDMRDAIAKVCSAYKRGTGKKLSVKPQDAAQLRRLLESGIELAEFIGVGEKAWKSNSFLSKYSHQLAMFVKHYGNIRNEVDSPQNNGPEKNQLRENIAVRSL